MLSVSLRIVFEIASWSLTKFHAIQVMTWQNFLMIPQTPSSSAAAARIPIAPIAQWNLRKIWTNYCVIVACFQLFSFLFLCFNYCFDLHRKSSSSHLTSRNERPNRKMIDSREITICIFLLFFFLWAHWFCADRQDNGEKSQVVVSVM